MRDFATHRCSPRPLYLVCAIIYQSSEIISPVDVCSFTYIIIIIIHTSLYTHASAALERELISAFSSCGGLHARDPFRNTCSISFLYEKKIRTPLKKKKCRYNIYTIHLGSVFSIKKFSSEKLNIFISTTYTPIYKYINLSVGTI